jgi:hypothetical protein
LNFEFEILNRALYFSQSFEFRILIPEFLLFMYRRPKFLTVLIRIRENMSREADYDVDLFAEMVRSG